MGRVQILLGGKDVEGLTRSVDSGLTGSRGILDFFGHLTDHFCVCLDHFAINLQMTVQGLDLHSWRRRVTKLGHTEWLLLLLLTLLVFRAH